MIHSQKITTSSCSAAASVAVTEMDVGFVDRAAVEMFLFFLKNHFRYIGVTDFYDWCLFSNSRL